MKREVMKRHVDAKGKATHETLSCGHIYDGPSIRKRTDERTCLKCPREPHVPKVTCGQLDRVGRLL